MRPVTQCIVLFLLAALLLPLAGCGQKQDGNPATNAAQTEKRQAIIEQHKNK